jgi:hypothetical protein
MHALHCILLYDKIHYGKHQTVCHFDMLERKEGIDWERLFGGLLLQWRLA